MTSFSHSQNALINTMNAQPKLAKGAKGIVEVSATAWIDLLGYGSMLRDVQFDPTSLAAKAAVHRLDCFHAHIAGAATKYSTALVINDGAVICRDLSARSASVTYDFIRRIVQLHTAINAAEREEGFPGARCVIASGFRIRRRNHHKSSLIDGYGTHLINQLEGGAISAEEGIKSAITVKPFMATVPEIQANFAFTKAYLAESSGSIAGFSGARVFLDMALVSRSDLPWLMFDEIFDWSAPGMSGKFGAIKVLDTTAARRTFHSGCRDAYEVAEALSTSPEILDRLRKLRVSGNGAEKSEPVG